MLFLLGLPGVVLLFLLRYIPMFGIIVAFEDYRPQTGFFSMVESCNLECDQPAFQQALTAMPGIGQTGETCGGVSGPLMALGLALGPSDPKDKEQAAKCFASAHKLATAMKEEFGRPG